MRQFRTFEGSGAGPDQLLSLSASQTSNRSKRVGDRREGEGRTGKRDRKGKRKGEGRGGEVQKGFAAAN